MSTNRLNQLLQYLEDSPDDAFLLFAVAKEYEKNEDRDKALQYYRQLVAKTPDYVGVYYHLGKLYEKLEEPGKALQTYEQGMRVAQEAGDQHALSELAGARMNLEE